jgi:hypothetical protein
MEIRTLLAVIKGVLVYDDELGHHQLRDIYIDHDVPPPEEATVYWSTPNINRTIFSCLFGEKPDSYHLLHEYKHKKFKYRLPADYFLQGLLAGSNNDEKRVLVAGVGWEDYLGNLARIGWISPGEHVSMLKNGPTRG